MLDMWIGSILTALVAGWLYKVGITRVRGEAGDLLSQPQSDAASSRITAFAQ